MARKLCVIAVLLALIVVMGDTLRAQDARGVLQAAGRTRGGKKNTARGGGADPPLQGEQQQVAIVSGNYAWNLDGQNPVPQPGQYLAGLPVAEFRQLDILLTPYGFLKAALASSNPTAISLTLPQSPGGITQNGKATIVSFTAMGKYRVNGTFNDQNMLELVQTWVPNPVYGDMLY